MASVKNGKGFIGNGGECPSMYAPEDMGLANNDTHNKINISDIVFVETNEIEMKTDSDGLNDLIHDFDPVKSALLTRDEIAAALLEDLSTESCLSTEQVTTLNVRKRCELRSSDSGSENETGPRFENSTCNNKKYYLHRLLLEERETYSCDCCDRYYFKKSSLSDHIKQ